jgi:hypothetical protein
MVDLSGLYPSKYYKVDDLDNDSEVVVMNDVRMEEMQNEQKAVLYFQGKTKGLVLNRTNLKNIAGKYTHHTDRWIGQPIVLYRTFEQIQGKNTEVLRARPPSDRDLARGKQAVTSGRQSGATWEGPAPTAAGQSAPLDDDVPFMCEWR